MKASNFSMQTIHHLNHRRYPHYYEQERPIDEINLVQNPSNTEIEQENPTRCIESLIERHKTKNKRERERK